VYNTRSYTYVQLLVLISYLFAQFTVCILFCNCVYFVLYCYFYVYYMSICIVCTSVRTTATG
jgi:hypothetical protein